MNVLKSFLCTLIVLSVLSILISCSSSKSVTKNKNTSTKSTKSYSKQLGINLNGSENPELIETISDWLGTPHKMGGYSKKGVDCSGLANIIYKDVYKKSLNRSSADIYKQCTKIDKANLIEGDLVFFKIKKKKISHVGIYIKDNKFVHATIAKGVIISDLNEEYYKKYFVSGGRIKD